MSLQDYTAALAAGERISADSPLLGEARDAAQDALRITAELNGRYHEPARVRELLAELTGSEIDESVVVFPPLRADFGKSLRIGKNVFISSGCVFQDQGGVTIGDDCLIGHNAVFATLNHDLDPARRGDLLPAPITLGRGVWVGANVVFLPGVNVGDDAVVAASCTVTKDVPAGAVVVGSPARVVRYVPGYENPELPA